MHLVTDIHEPMLLESGFALKKIGHDSAWRSYAVDNDWGVGEYHIFSPDGSYSINVHDFTLKKDLVIHSTMPEYLSVTWYDSEAGKAVRPYKTTNRGVVQGYHFDKEGYHALVHKDIPIYTIGIEITPEYADKYLKAKYPGEVIDAKDVFLNINEDNDFPEMIYLMHQIKNFKGSGTEAELFYEGKVHEAMSLLVKRKQKTSRVQEADIPAKDKTQVISVTSYINDNLIGDLSIDALSKVACMSPTKLKKKFKQYHDLTITEYIQIRRIKQSEMLLSNTDLSISNIAESVGYRSAGRFTALFKKYTGLLPSEYKKMEF